MTSSPDEVRTGLAIVTTAAAAELVSSAEPAETAADLRALLFLAAPVIVSDYSDGAAALALDWYEELRETAEARRRFTPEPFQVVTDDYVRAQVAAATTGMLDVPAGRFDEVKAATLSLVADSLPEMVADGFRETITRNSINDPSSAGWKRFARPGACKFCQMLAAKGAVFTEKTARFAAHGAVMNGGRKGGDCQCVAAPEFGTRSDWSEATPLQYVASKRTRSPKEKARLREYLNENFSDPRKSALNKPAPSGAYSRKPDALKPEAARGGFEAMSIAQVENQIRILEGLKDSDYKAKQLPRLRKRLAELRA